MTSGSVTSAITLSASLQNGHTEVSISKTPFSRSAKLIGAVGERRVTEDSAGLVMAGSHRFLRAGFPWPAPPFSGIASWLQRLRGSRLKP
jgi:hypothetical protein